jgi:hypothetical protein
LGANPKCTEWNVIIPIRFIFTYRTEVEKT